MSSGLASICYPHINRFYFTSGGAEANESALKLAVQLTNRTRFTAFKGSFHGRTTLALSVTDSPCAQRIPRPPEHAGEETQKGRNAPGRPSRRSSSRRTPPQSATFSAIRCALATAPDRGKHRQRPPGQWVIVPGLRHFYTRFAPGRLYDVPVKLGYLDQPLSENELTPFLPHT